MGNLGIDGLASGLDTTSLINSLMQVEAGPQTLLKAKASTAQTFVSALQGLNTRVASLATVAAAAAKAESWSVWKATSSASGASATTSTTAQPGSVSFSVDAVATTQVTLSATFTDVASLFTTNPPVVTIKKSDGTLVTVTPAAGDLAAVTKAINDAADAGIKATAIRVSNSDPPEYRLQFTGTSTGSAGSFGVYAGTAAEVGLGTAPRIDGNVVRTAGNAQVTLWKGSPLEKTYAQSSNTFTGLMTGVDVTVAKATAVGEDPVTITVGRDDAAVKKLASDLVGSLGVVLSEITSRTKTTSTTTDGRTSVVGGVLTGDSAVRGIAQQLTQAMSYPVDGFSPSDVGIVLGKDGTFTFDEAVFTAALAADPARVQSMVSQIAGRVSVVATSVSDPFEGSLSLKVKGQQSLVTDYGTQIEDWDRRLELRREGLQKTYSALEVTLANLQSQSSWLTSQLANLPSYS